MSKNHEVTGVDYTVYKKNRPYEDTVEEEESKVQREKLDYTRRRQKNIVHMRHALHAVQELDEEDLWDEDLEEDEFEAERALHNMRTHKRRIKGTEKHEDRSASEA